MKLRFKALAVLGLALSLGLSVGLASAEDGGPDAFGYRFVDSNESDGPNFNYVDISSSATSAGDASDCDDCGEFVPIGFDFMFYGEEYSEVYVTSNGTLSFDDDDSDYENEGIPSDVYDERVAFVLWDDLDSSYCGDVFYETRGSAGNRQFIVQWTVCNHDGSEGDSCSGDFEVILFESNGSLLMQYLDTIFTPANPADPEDCAPGDEVNNGGSASVGIQQDPELGLEYSNDGSVEITTGLAICFSLQGERCGSSRRTQERQPPPNLGAGLSGLFNGQPTPLPGTAPVAPFVAPAAPTVAPAATSPVISPPRTGDAGLADWSPAAGLAVGASIFVLMALGATVKVRFRA